MRIETAMGAQIKGKGLRESMNSIRMPAIGYIPPLPASVVLVTNLLPGTQDSRMGRHPPIDHLSQ